jgi:hypothetical protein
LLGYSGSCEIYKEIGFELVQLIQLVQVEVLIVAYLLKAGTVEAEQQPLLGNGPYTLSREMRHVRYDVTQQ